MNTESRAPRRTKQVRKPSLLSKSLEEMTKDVNEIVESVASKVDDVLPTVDRPSMRPPLREEDPRIAADRRAAEILNNIGDVDQGTDEFAAPRPPDGWSYEWKRKEVMGQEQASYLTQIQYTGWQPVPASRHPETMPLNTKSATIERKGMILMQRPLSITEKMQQLDKKRARDQVVAKQQQLNEAPQGHFERNHPQAQARVKNTYESVPVPRD